MLLLGFAPVVHPVSWGSFHTSGCPCCGTPLVTTGSMAAEAGMGHPVRPRTGHQVLVHQLCPCVFLCLFLV